MPVVTRLDWLGPKPHTTTQSGMPRQYTTIDVDTDTGTPWALKEAHILCTLFRFLRIHLDGKITTNRFTVETHCQCARMKGMGDAVRLSTAT